MTKKFEIRNSTAEFLTFVATGKEDGIQVLYKDETIWATQKSIATLFDVGIPTINKHLANIFAEGELKKESTISKMEIVQTETYYTACQCRERAHGTNHLGKCRKYNC